MLAPNKLAVLLEPEMAIPMEGDLVLRTLRGALTVNGHRITPECDPVTVTSHRSTGLLQLQPCSRTTSTSGGLTGPKDSDAVAVSSKFVKRKGTVVIISPTDSESTTKRSTPAPSGTPNPLDTLATMLTLCRWSGKTPVRRSPRMAAQKSSPAAPTTSLDLGSGRLLADHLSSKNAVSFPKEWSDCLDGIVTASERPGYCCTVLGAKNTGKSTLCRTMVNRLLLKHQQVAYLDIDLGQAEFSPPGFVSLHLVSSPVLSPPQRHLATARCAFFLGESTAQHDPSRYIEAIRQAHSYYLDSPDLGKVPLVVNSAGWLTGLGAELALEVVGLLSPAHVVRLVRPTESGAAAAAAEDPSVETGVKAKGRLVSTLLSVAKGKISTGSHPLAASGMGRSSRLTAAVVCRAECSTA